MTLAHKTSISSQFHTHHQDTRDITEGPIQQQRKESCVYYHHQPMRVNIAAEGQEFSMEVGPQEPILELKYRLQQILDFPVASQVLSVSGWELIDGLDMEDYPIVVEGTVIDLTIKCAPLPFPYSTKFQINVKFSAKQITMDVDHSDTVGSLKEKIHIVNGTPIKRMMLFFSGSEMADDFRSLSEYGVCELSDIVVLFKAPARGRDNPPLERRVGLVVQTPSTLLNAAKIPLDMKDSSTVHELREVLVGSQILPADEYLFIHKQRIMRNNCSLRSHGVENGDYVYVFKGSVSRGYQY